LFYPSKPEKFCQQFWEREWIDYAVEQVPQMQLQAMKRRHIEIQKTSRGKDLVYTVWDKNANPNDRKVQNPRVFNRWETETNPLIMAKL
jgi:hypothetical protein